MDSEIADIKNYHGKPFAGAITAAKFLQAFTHEHPAWAHLDIAGVALSGKMFIAGMAIFSGSLYLLTFLQIAGYTQFNWLGAITPIGGLLLVLAWVWLAISVYRFNG